MDPTSARGMVGGADGGVARLAKVAKSVGSMRWVAAESF